MVEFKHSPAVAAAPSAALAQDPPTPAAAIRFAWTVCVPHQAETMSFDGFLTMARKVYLVRQLRTRGAAVDPIECLQTVKRDWQRFCAFKAHLTYEDFERFWSHVSPEEDEACWIVAMVHRIVEPYYLSDTTTGLTLWRWREDGDLFERAPGAVRGASRFYTANVSHLLEQVQQTMAGDAEVVGGQPVARHFDAASDQHTSTAAKAALAMLAISSVTDASPDVSPGPRRAHHPGRASPMHGFGGGGGGGATATAVKVRSKTADESGQQQLLAAVAVPAAAKKNEGALKALEREKRFPGSKQQQDFAIMHWNTVFSQAQRRERELMTSAAREFEEFLAACRVEVGGVAAAVAAERPNPAGAYAAFTTAQTPVLRAPWELPPVRARRRSGPSRVGSVGGLVRSSSEATPSFRTRQTPARGPAAAPAEARLAGAPSAANLRSRTPALTPAPAPAPAGPTPTERYSTKSGLMRRRRATTSSLPSLRRDGSMPQVVGSEPAARRRRPLEPLGTDNEGADGGVRRDPCGSSPDAAARARRNSGARARGAATGGEPSSDSPFLTQDGTPAEEALGARTRRPPAANRRSPSPTKMGPPSRSPAAWHADGDPIGDPAEGEQSPSKRIDLERQKLRTPTGTHWSPVRQRHRRATDSELMRGVYLASLAFNVKP